jgi:Response regulator containing a CheY-like receiver domain and an HTH DNA-binding domain
MGAPGFLTASTNKLLLQSRMVRNTSLVIIEDNRLVREGIASLIREQSDFKVLVASADIEEAMEKVCTTRPRVVLLDLGLKNQHCLNLAAVLHREVPEASVIVMGLLPTQDDIADFVRVGVAGFVMKNTSLDDFLTTIRRVAEGEKILPSQLTGTLFAQIVRKVVHRDKIHVSMAVRLTQRERQVIELIGEGMSNKEIAARLHIATHTVKSHVHNILDKLALHTRLEVAAFTRTGTD